MLFILLEQYLKARIRSEESKKQNNIPLHLIFENNHCLIAFSKPRVNKHMKAKLNTENLAAIILLINFNKLKLGTL